MAHTHTQNVSTESNMRYEMEISNPKTMNKPERKRRVKKKHTLDVLIIHVLCAFILFRQINQKCGQFFPECIDHFKGNQHNKPKKYSQDKPKRFTHEHMQCRVNTKSKENKYGA